MYGEEAGVERTFPMDLVPRIIPADEWDVVEAGLVQRVTALNRFLEDLYDGGRVAIRDGIVPRWLIASADGFRREAFGIPAPARCDGAWWPASTSSATTQGVYRVLEDNLRNPVGDLVRPREPSGR